MDHIDFGGQRSKVKVTIDIYGNKLVNTIKTKPLCAFSSNLADNHGERMISLDFGGHRSKAKATMGIIDKMLGVRACYALRCYIFAYFTSK